MLRVAATAADLRRWWEGAGPAPLHRCGSALAVNVHGLVCKALCPTCLTHWTEPTLLAYDDVEAATRFYVLRRPFETRQRLVWIVSGESMHLGTIDYVDGARGTLADGRAWYSYDYDGRAE